MTSWTAAGRSLAGIELSEGGDGMCRPDRESAHGASKRRLPARQVAAGAVAGLVATGAVAVGSLTAQAATPSSFDAVQVKAAFAGSLVVVGAELLLDPDHRAEPHGGNAVNEKL